MRRWTLNADHGYYVATGLSERRLDLELSYKDSGGRVHDVGRFSMSLSALTRLGVVTERTVGGGSVFDVRIVREPDGVYWLSVRSTARQPLEEFRVV